MELKTLFQLHRSIFTYEKLFPFDIFWKNKYIGFIFYTQIYNHKIKGKCDLV